MIRLKSPFFAAKTLLYITAGVIFAYLLSWGGVAIKNRVDHNRQVRAAQAQQEKIKKLSPEEQSILKAQQRLVDSITQVETSERIFLSYLQRKFDLPKILGSEGPIIDLYEDPNTGPDQIHYLARIAYPDRLVKDPPKNEPDEDFKLTNIYSANCDHIPLPNNFWPIMEQNLQAGGYKATHVALAFAMMKDNGCPLPPGGDDMKNRVTRVMVKLAGSADTIADLRYEAIAFLYLGEHRDLVQSDWIKKITAEQRVDGGWSKEVGSKKYDAHSTLLALWSLLEYSRPNIPNEPLIRRPSNS